MAKKIKAMAGTLWRKLSGAEARERQARREEAEALLLLHDSRSDFAPDKALEGVVALLGEEEGKALFSQFIGKRIEATIRQALEDKVLDPAEEARIAAVLARYGNPKIDKASRAVLDRARRLYKAMTAPLTPVSTPLLLRKGEYCVFGVEAEALEERSRTVRVNYGGPTVRVRIVKGVYYSMGSMAVERKTEAFMHSFGDGVLAATNKRLLWMSPSKTISIPLPKIVMFKPYSDGVKIHKDTGKPILFSWAGDNGIGAVTIGRVIEELRDA